MAPTPTGVASCMNRPRLYTVRTASAKGSAPAATTAAYSPTLWPARARGASGARAASSRWAMVATVRIAAWAL